MNRSMTLVASLALTTAAFTLTGCGPDAQGMENRAAANNRVDSFHASFTYDQARKSFEIGQFEKSMRLVQKAIARYPEMPEYFLLKGRIHLEQQELEAALAAFVRAAELNETDATPHYYTGIVFERWSNDAKAHEHYMEAFELDQTSPMYLLAAAESLIAIEEYAKAWDIIALHLDYFEHNAAMRQLQGQIAALQGNLAYAADLYSQARLLNPDDVSLLEELVWVQFDAEEYGSCYDSLRQLKRHLATDTDRFDLKLLEARCLNLMQRSSEARDLYIALTQERPGDVTIWIELGRIAWESGDKQRLAQCSNRITALAPNRAEGYLIDGVVQRNAGNHEAAVKAFTRATKCDDADALCFIFLGATLELDGRTDEAIAAYRGALELNPNDPDASVLLRNLLASGNPQ